MKERNPPCKNAATPSHIAEISRSVLRRPGAGRAGLLRLFRLLARLPLSAVPARPRLPRRRNRLRRDPPQWRVPPFRRGKSPHAGAHPERCRRAGASRVDERLLHRDLGKSPRPRSNSIESDRGLESSLRRTLSRNRYPLRDHASGKRTHERGAPSRPARSCNRRRRHSPSAGAPRTRLRFKVACGARSWYVLY